MPRPNANRPRTHADGWLFANTKFLRSDMEAIVALADLTLSDAAGKQLLSDVIEALHWYPGAAIHQKQAPTAKAKDVEIETIEALAGQLREALSRLSAESRESLERPPIREVALERTFVGRQLQVARWRAEIAVGEPAPRLTSVHALDTELSGLERACTMVRYYLSGKESRGAKPDRARRTALTMLSDAFQRAVGGAERIDQENLTSFLVKACKAGNIPLPRRRDRIADLLQ